MKQNFKYVLIGILVFVVFFSGGNLLVKALVSSADVADKNFEDDEEEERIIDLDGDRTNILILGVDARPGEERSRSDVIILASIDPDLKKIALISIPRDTRVNINASHLDKMGTANFYGGPKLAVSIAEKLMNVHIDHYIEMDFNGFKEIIDAVGGVTVNVAQAMYKPSEGINLQPGMQTLTGTQALAFVRYRDYANGDIERVQAQQSFLKDLAREVLSPASIIKIPTFVQIAYKNVSTDMGIRDMLRLASWAPAFSADEIITQTLPGYFYDERDENGNLTASYWMADKTIATSLLNNMFAGTQVATLIQTQTVTHVNESEAAKTKDSEEGQSTEEATESEDKKATAIGPSNQEKVEDAGGIVKEPEYIDETLNTTDVSGNSDNINPLDTMGTDLDMNLDMNLNIQEINDQLDTIEQLPVISPEELEWQRERARENS